MAAGEQILVDLVNAMAQGTWVPPAVLVDACLDAGRDADAEFFRQCHVGLNRTRLTKYYFPGPGRTPTYHLGGRAKTESAARDRLREHMIERLCRLAAAESIGFCLPGQLAPWRWNLRPKEEYNG